jgi:hypothetical protein
MKTARHQTGATRPPFKRKSDAREPDRIIVPAVQDGHSYGKRFSSFEYTDFEEIAGSDAYDQLVFLEYAHEDHSRLRVSGK